MGYWRAGFHDITGVDHKPQKNYPFDFHQADVFEWCAENDLNRYDLIHASPPCQKFSTMTKGRWKDREHLDFISIIRYILKASGRFFVIENVPGAPLINHLTLCGSMFGLETKAGNQLRRHRLFEIRPTIFKIMECRHNIFSTIGVYGGGQHPKRRKAANICVYGNTGGQSKRDAKAFFGIKARREVMQIKWMTNQELNQAVPPAYTEWIGQQLKGRL